jgi:hypothetical protein
LSETLAAKYGPSLCRAERNRGFLSATGADSYGFLFGKVTRRSPGGSPFLLAGFAAFGYVLELFVVEEKLLSGGKYKIFATVHTLQYFVLEFHGFPFQPKSTTSLLRKSKAARLRKPHNSLPTQMIRHRTQYLAIARRV